MPEKWTAEHIPDLSGKVVIITGANSGLGFETAKVVAQKRAVTVLACRNLEKAQAAQKLIHDALPEALTDIILIDLGDLSSIRKFTSTFMERYQRLDILMNNAGLIAGQYQKTKDGFEKHFGINHLGHFALTGLLFDYLHKTPESRIVTVSSLIHGMRKLDFTNLMYDGGKGYRSMAAYSRSKLANMLFTYELQRRLTNIGSSTIAVAAHPGISTTNMAPYIRFSKIVFPFAKMVLPSPRKGACAGLRAATDPSAEGGSYFGPRGLMGISGAPVIAIPSNFSRNEAHAKKLWEISENLTGVKYP